MSFWRLGVALVAALLALVGIAGGVRHFMWHGWQVKGDIRGPTDRYLATRVARRVRWLF